MSENIKVTRNNLLKGVKGNLQ